MPQRWLWQRPIEDYFTVEQDGPDAAGGDIGARRQPGGGDGDRDTVVRDRHIRIEFFFGQGSPGRRRGLGLLSALATAIAFGLVAVLGGRLAYDDFIYEVTSPGIGVPQWWYTACLPVFAAAITARALQRFARLRRQR